MERKKTEAQKNLRKMRENLNFLKKTENFLKSSGRSFWELSEEERKKIAKIFRTARYLYARLKSYFSLTETQEELLEVLKNVKATYKRLLRY